METKECILLHAPLLLLSFFFSIYMAITGMENLLEDSALQTVYEAITRRKSNSQLSQGASS